MTFGTVPGVPPPRPAGATPRRRGRPAPFPAATAAAGSPEAGAASPEAGSPEAGSPAAGSPAARRAGRRATAVCVAVLALVSVLVPAIHVDVYREVSPVDELAHIDYTLRAPALVPTVSGDLWLQQTMREAACRGVDRGARPKPDCHTLVSDPRTFALDGYPSGYIHPPTYYDVTAVVGRVLQRVLGLASPVTGFRLVGVLWLFAGLLSVFAAARRFGADRVPTVAVLVMLAATPAVFYPDSIVNPDGASLLVGGLGLWLVHRWDSGSSRTGPLPLVLAGALSTGVKNQNLLIAGVFVLYLLGAALRHVPGWLRSGRRGPLPTDRLGRRVGGAAVLAGAALVVAAAWVVTIRLTATLPPAQQPMAERFTVPALPAGAIRTSLGLFVQPLVGTYIPAQYVSGWLTLFIGVTTWLFVATLVMTAVFLARTPRLRVLAWSLVPVAVFGAVAETLANWVVLHQYIGSPPLRYALPLVPVFAVLAAAAARTRSQSAGYVVVAGGSLVATCAVLLASAP